MIHISVKLLMFEDFTRGRPDRDKRQSGVKCLNGPAADEASTPQGDARIENHQTSISREFLRSCWEYFKSTFPPFEPSEVEADGLTRLRSTSGC